MKKVILFILLLIFLAVPISVKGAIFDDDIDEAYEKYVNYVNYSNNYYSINVYQGIVNNKPTYGIYFFSMTAKEYHIVLSNGQEEFVIKAYNRRGDIKALALEEIKEPLTILLYRDNVRQSFKEPIVLNPFTKEEFNQNAKYVTTGQNMGASITKLTVPHDYTNLIFIVAALAIVISCGIIILVFWKSKKGMFSEKTRKEDTFDFKEFLSQNFDENIQSADTIDLDEDDFSVENEEDLKQDDSTDKKSKDVYEKSYKDIEEERSGFSISDYLQDKGLVTDYKIASEEEKQTIMLELMRLRDEKKITNDEYLEEAYKLWKE